jgi:hypothetical protein
MANHTYTRAGGVWDPDTDLLAAELADLDAKTVDSISGTGGIYILADDLTLAAAPGVQFIVGALTDFQNDVQFQTQAFFYDEVTFNDDVSFGQDVDFYGLTDFKNDVQFQTNTFFYDDATFNDDVTVSASGLLDVYSEGRFHDDVSITGGTTLSGFLNADGNCFLGDPGFVEFLGDVTVRKGITFADTGAIAHRYVLGGDANASYSPRAVHEVVILDGTLTAARTYTINDTGCVDGQEIIFTNKDQTFPLIVLRPDAVNLGSNLGRWKRCKRISGNWQIVQEGDVRGNA